MPKIRETIESPFARKLIGLRKSRHLTQEQFGEKMGLSRSVIAYYEGGTKNPRLDTICKFAEFFNVAPEFMIAESDDNSKPGPKSNLEIQLERVKHLSPMKQKLVSDMIEAVLENS